MTESATTTGETRPNLHPLGKGYELNQSQSFHQSVDELFDFFADPRNLEKITPPWLNFSVESCGDRPVREGTTIHYTLSLHGFPVSWTTRIKEYSENEYFVDEMIDGPYRVWEHIHTFERIRGRTVMGDQVYYEMPCGWVGELAHRWLVKGDLENIFTYRAEALRSIFGPGND